MECPRSGKAGTGWPRELFRWHDAHVHDSQVVLDVGCGTGVLSCFAARAGAAKVIGVDRSDIVLKAREVVRDNGFDGIVHLIQVCVSIYLSVCVFCSDSTELVLHSLIPS